MRYNISSICTTCSQKNNQTAVEFLPVLRGTFRAACQCEPQMLQTLTSPTLLSPPPWGIMTLTSPLLCSLHLACEEVRERVSEGVPLLLQTTKPVQQLAVWNTTWMPVCVCVCKMMGEVEGVAWSESMQTFSCYTHIVQTSARYFKDYQKNQTCRRFEKAGWWCWWYIWINIFFSISHFITR